MFWLEQQFVTRSRSVMTPFNIFRRRRLFYVPPTVGATATATATTSRRRGRPVIDGDRAAQGAWRRGSQGRVVWMLGKQTLTHESVKLTHGSAERALGIRTVKHEWGVNCDWRTL